MTSNTHTCLIQVRIVILLRIGYFGTFWNTSGEKNNTNPPKSGYAAGLGVQSGGYINASEMPSTFFPSYIFQIGTFFSFIVFVENFKWNNFLTTPPMGWSAANTPRVFFNYIYIYNCRIYEFLVIHRLRFSEMLTREFYRKLSF